MAPWFVVNAVRQLVQQQEAEGTWEQALLLRAACDCECKALGRWLRGCVACSGQTAHGQDQLALPHLMPRAMVLPCIRTNILMEMASWPL